MTVMTRDNSSFDFQVAEKGEFMGINLWGDELGDLSWVSDDNKHQLKQKLREQDKKHGNDDNEYSIGINTGQLVSFVSKMDIGDVVILPIETNIEFTGDTYTYNEKAYLIGRIKSRYYFAQNPQDTCSCWHRRDIEWIKTVPRDALSEQFKNTLGAHLTVFNVSKHEEEIEALLKGERIAVKPIEVKTKIDMLEENVQIQKRLMSISPHDFEKLVSQVLSLKYGVITAKTRDLGDGGTDFVALDDKGRHIKYRGQVKRVSRNISNSEILQLRGTLLDGEEGIFVITSYFTPPALEEAEFMGKKKIYTIDGRQLSQFILDVYEDLSEEFKNILKIEK